MGVGYCFKDDLIPGAALQIGGEAVSLRPEAAAMWQIFIAACTLPDYALAIMCDSLGLLRMLQGFRK